MEKTLDKTIKIDGTIKKFTANKHGDIHSLEITHKDKVEKIDFPPHTAKAILAAVAEEDLVEITFTQEDKKGPKENKKPKNKLQTIKVDGSGNELSVSDLKPVKPGFSDVLENFVLDNYELLKDKKEELIGIKYDGKLFHINKECAAFSALIKPKADLKIVASKRIDEGFINTMQMDVYHILSITIDGKNYQSQHH